MNSLSKSVPLFLVFLAMLTGCENASSSRTTRDAAIGATAGAVIGGVIGHNSGDEAAEGAAIGAAVGAAAGAVHGRSRERDRERNDEPIRYSDRDYRELLTDEEVDILQARARASNRDDYALTDFLTEREKENLRRRDAARRDERRDREIGR